MAYGKWNLFFICLFAAGGLQANDVRTDAWEITHYMSDSVMVGICDKGSSKSPIEFFQREDSPTFNPGSYQNIQNGDVLWIKCKFLKPFFDQVLPNIQNHFALLMNIGDESFPSNSGLNTDELHQLLSDDRLIRIFTINCDLPYAHPKITLMPIGIDYHTIAYKSPQGGWGETGTPLEQEAKLQQMLRTFLPTNQRKKLAFVDFHFSDTIRGGDQKRYLQFGEDRTTIFNRLLRTGLIDHGNWMRRSALWETKGQYAFSISPHGNGLDCHRTWEDLILGCIVIVKTSTLDPLYKDLPVVIIEDWSEITRENLEKWLVQYGDAFTNPAYREKLSHLYWINQILLATSPYKKKMPT